MIAKDDSLYVVVSFSVYAVQEKCRNYETSILFFVNLYWDRLLIMVN